jgi:hypothetical protein
MSSKSITDVVAGKSHALFLSSGRLEFDGILGLLSLCSLTQMIHMMDIRTYQPRLDQTLHGKTAEEWLNVRDVNCVPDPERLARAHARGQAMEIVDWLTITFTLDGAEWRALCDTWLRHHMMAVVKFHRYKQEQQPQDSNILEATSQITRQFIWYHLDIPPQIVQEEMKTKTYSVAWPWGREHDVGYSGEFYSGAEGKYIHARKQR